ncbi:hypothetical protein niasHS_005014 [Heterodera schachtii]|uniref:B box-type domain-containing protein n=1 Tax=Heterodera schachtii TaxID=97005 RepID=A0ABD2JKC1_HETSC
MADHRQQQQEIAEMGGTNNGISNSFHLNLLKSLEDSIDHRIVVEQPLTAAAMFEDQQKQRERERNANNATTNANAKNEEQKAMGMMMNHHGMAKNNNGGGGGGGTVPMPLSSSSCSGGSAGSPLLDTGQALSDDPTICPYCNKKFRKPRVLDCLHSMCEDCVIAQLGGDIENANKQQRHHPHFGRASTDFELEQHMNNLRPTPPGVIRCPVCSQETHIGNDIMFVNLMLLDFVRIREIGLNGRGDERICGACKSEEAAVANCLHCCSDLCNKCVQAHHDMRMFDGHKVMMFSDLNQPSDEFTKSEAEFKLVACTKHRADFIAVCFSCDELLCKDCVDSGEHYAHKWSFLNSEVDILCRQTLQELGQQAEQKGKATLDARESIPDRKELLHLSSNKCREKIEEAFVYYVHVLSEVKAQLLAELEKNRDEKEEYLDSLYKKIDMQTSKLQDALRYTNCLLEKGTVTELCLNKNKVRQQLKLLIHSMPDANAEVDLDFDSPTKAEFKKKLESIVGAIKCRVTGLPKDAKGLNLLANEQQPHQQPTKIEGLSLSDMKYGTGAGGHLSAVASPIWDSANKSTSMLQQQQAILAAAYQQQQQQQNPGTIGMERRMMRNSNGTSIGCGGQSYLSGDSGNFSTSDMTLSSPISNSGGGGMIGAGVGAAHNQMANLHASLDNFGMGRFGADSFPGFRTPTGGGLTSPDAMVMGGQQFCDPTNPMFPDTNNYLSGSQSKLWAGQFNSSNMFSQFDSTPAHQRPRELMESRFTMGEFGAGGYGNSSCDLSAGMRSRSSLCNTPSMDQFVTASSIASQQDFLALGNGGGGGGGGRAHQQFGSGSPANDMTLCKHFNADKNNGADTFNTPQGICLGLDSEIAIADTNNHRCIVVNFNDGTFVRSIGSSGTEEGSVYYPKKVVSLVRGRDCLYIVLDRGSNQLFNRLQLFKNNGEYVCRLVPPSPCPIDQVTVMSVNKENEQLVIIDNKNVVHAFEFELFSQLRLTRHFSISGYVHEASDIAVFKGQYYITDYKTHCVVIYSLEGKQMGKFGGLNITPYPVGIDFSKTGDILVGDSHGNHFHIVVFSSAGQPLVHYRCHLQKVSRCTGLKIAADGRIITLSRQSSSVLVFNTLFLPTT